MVEQAQTLLAIAVVLVVAEAVKVELATRLAVLAPQIKVTAEVLVVTQPQRTMAVVVAVVLVRLALTEVQVLEALEALE